MIGSGCNMKLQQTGSLWIVLVYQGGYKNNTGTTTGGKCNVEASGDIM